MKKAILLSINFLIISLLSQATVHTVQVANYQFSPANITDVQVGDVIHWIWVSGSHTSTCDPSNPDATGTSLPAGAPTWDSRLNSTSTTFDYTVTVAGTYNYWCNFHAPDMKASFTASNVLPLKLSPLFVTGSNGKVTIEWKTQNEENTNYFSVRRSANGSIFDEIAQIPAAGNSAGEKSYSYTDTKISGQQKYYYYNLSIVDKDGKQTLSDTKIFKNSESINRIVLTLSPNPISRPGHLMLTFNAEKEGKMDVKVINAEGKSIITTSMQAYSGVNNGHIHLGELPAGTYTLIFIMDGIKESHQIIYK